jgi:hypothetical protein
LNKCFIVDGRGKGGGLALFWREERKVQLLSYELHHIDTFIWDGSHHAAWRGTFVYGEPRTHDRFQMWELLRRIKPCQYAPWLMIGDFNEVMWSYEHFSQHRRPQRQMIDFRVVLSFCDLHDLDFQGLPWTYDNKQKGVNNVRVRLDRDVASPSWLQWFPNAKLKHLVTVISDHCPILLNLDAGNSKAPVKRIARYEIMWERDDALSGEIKLTWEACRPANDLGDVVKMLQSIMGSLRTWSFNHFDSVNKEMENIKERLEQQSRSNVVTNQEEIDRLSKRMEELLYREEMMWLKRSRISWLKEVDRNTSFFHRKASCRGKKNKVEQTKE